MHDEESPYIKRHRQERQTTNHRTGGNACDACVRQGLLFWTHNSQAQSQQNPQTTQFKNGPRTCVDISPKEKRIIKIISGNPLETTWVPKVPKTVDTFKNCLSAFERRPGFLGHTGRGLVYREGGRIWSQMLGELKIRCISLSCILLVSVFRWRCCRSACN